MNKKINIETHPIEKIILAAFLGPFVVLGYILFFVTTYTLVQRVIEQDYDGITSLVIGIVVSLVMAVAFTKPFQILKRKAGPKKGNIIQLQLISIDQDETYERQEGGTIYFPTLFTFIDDKGVHIEMEQFASNPTCKRYEQAIKESDPRLLIKVKEYENEYYISVQDLAEFRNEFNNEPITTVGLDEHKIK